MNAQQIPISIVSKNQHFIQKWLHYLKLKFRNSEAKLDIHTRERLEDCVKDAKPLGENHYVILEEESQLDVSENNKQSLFWKNLVLFRVKKNATVTDKLLPSEYEEHVVRPSNKSKVHKILKKYIQMEKESSEFLTANFLAGLIFLLLLVFALVYQFA